MEAPMKMITIRSVFMLFIIFFATIVLGQNKIDFWLKNLCELQKQQPATLEKIASPALKINSSEKNPMVDVIIQLDNEDFSFLDLYGAKIRTRIGTFATAFLPLNMVTEIAKLDQVIYISGSSKVSLLNEKAMQITGIDTAKQLGFTGKDVIMGVIDSGIDINYPGFKNDNGSRILYLWDQTEEGSGTTAPYYNYGIEWEKEQIDRGECTELDTNGHGTHMAGAIAQSISSGFASNYNGGAVESNLIVVKTDLSSTKILDGVNYIFEKAKQLGKPAIINISLGSQQGPHDGTDPITAATDYLTGPGKIVVRSAGNDGNSFIHHKIETTPAGELMEFILDTKKDTLPFELWYDGSYNVTIKIIAPGNNLIVTAPPGTTTNYDTIKTNLGNIIIDNASSGPEFYNGDKKISLTLYDAVQGKWAFKISSPNPTSVHAWMYGGSKDGFRFNTTDNHYTITNEACGRNVIVVGAMVTRNEIQVQNTEGYADGTTLTLPDEIIGEVAIYSSGGPTRDGRNKPDVIAPGTIIAAAMSSDIGESQLSGLNDFRAYGNRYEVFGSEPTERLQWIRGTSPAATYTTVQTGFFAEQNPNLSPSGAINLLKKYAKQLSEVQIPPMEKNSASEIWDYQEGYGLVDLREYFKNPITVVSCKQITGNQLELTFNSMVDNLDNPSNYEILGASANTSIVASEIKQNSIIFNLNNKLREGYRDSLIISNIQGFIEPEIIEIEKIGTIVDIPLLITNQTWSPKNSPYYIHGEVSLDSSIQIKIEPGTVIKFMPNELNNSQLVVFGKMIAIGLVDLPIIFTSLTEDNHGAWEGLYFDSKIPQTNLQHCKIKYANFGITCFSDSLSLTACEISNTFNTGFWAKDCSPIIKKTIIWNSRGGEYSDGIYLLNATSASQIENVTIYGNERVGIFCSSSNTTIKNSIIENNQYGIYVNNTPSPTITYSNIFNSVNFSGVSPGTGCISKNSQFTDPENGVFSLKSDSPCLDSGDPNSQQDPDGTIADMGAMYYDATPVPVELSSFEATIMDNHILLHWITQSELNNLGFELERSEDNINFVKIAFIKGNDTCLNVHHYQYCDYNIESSTAYYYRLKQIDHNGLFCYSSVITSSIGLPQKFLLFQNYPNPFNPKTTIRYNLPQSCHVKLHIYDLLGQKISTLVNEDKKAGRYIVTFKPTNLPSGLYFYRLSAGDFKETKKLIIQK